MYYAIIQEVNTSREYSIQGYRFPSNEQYELELTVFMKYLGVAAACSSKSMLGHISSEHQLYYLIDRHRQSDH